LYGRIARPLAAFARGFHSILPVAYVRVFTPHEMNVALCGAMSIEVTDWIANTSYVECTSRTPTVVLFWDYVRELPDEKLRQILHFATGSRVVVR
jgi:hypothetical protein